MDVNGKNMGTWDFMHDMSEGRAELGRDRTNDSEEELTTNRTNRIFFKITNKIKNFFNKKSK